MLRARQRLKRLEEEIMPAADDYPKTMTICFVDSEKRVVREKVITFADVRPAKRRWGLAPSRRRP